MPGKRKSTITGYFPVSKRARRLQRSVVTRPMPFMSRSRYRSGQVSGSGRVFNFTFRAQSTLQIPTGEFIGKGLYAQLSNLPAAELTAMKNLFDEYQIYKVKVEFFPRGNSADSMIADSVKCPLIYSAIDLTDASNPNAPEDLMEFSTLRTHRWPEKFTRTWRPMVAKIVYNGANPGYSGGYAWVDCTNDTVPHYGLKLAVKSGGTAGGTQVFVDYLVTYMIRFRGRR